MKKYSIMIVDDVYTDRYLLKRTLRKLGTVAEIFEADDGRSALDFLTDYEENSKKYDGKFPPHLIFLDINMPMMNGFEFLEEFSKLKKDDDRYASSVIIMFTSSEWEEDKRKADSYDFVKGFVIKGRVSPESLQEMIEEHVLES